MDIDEGIARLEGGGILSEDEVKKCCEKLKELLVEESNVQPVAAPVTIAGDIHGQFYDLKELFRLANKPPETNFIFIGDFVDRGYNSVETWEYLMLLKIKYPSHVTLLRGNHESRQITLSYGFLDEITHKYGNQNVWNHCMEAFDLLPIGAVVEGEILCVHGGLSPELKTIDQMRMIERNTEIPHTGPFCDLMWSDPDNNIDGWTQSSRGAGWLFGAKVVKEFNRINGLSLIARAHQLVNEGFVFWFPDKNLVTVWSAPNYCYRCGNLAAFMEVGHNMERNFVTFKEVEESAKAPHYKTLLPYFL